MTISVRVDGDIQAVMRDLRFSVPGISKRAEVTALNKTNSKVGTRFRRELSRRSGIQQKVLRPQIKQYRATFRRRRARTFAGLRKTIRLSAVANKPTAKYDELARGTLYGKSGSKAFAVGISGGNTGYFVRKGRSRLPISHVRLSLAGIAPQALEAAVTQVGPDEFRRQYTYDLTRRLRRTGNRRNSRTRR